jgi:hypothetical protein
MTNDKFFVFDDVLTKKEHEDLFKLIKSVNYSNLWSSVVDPKGDRVDRMSGPWHWNHTFFQSEQHMPAMNAKQLYDLNESYPDMISLWAKANDLCIKYIGKYNILRLYANCNPYGTNAYPHEDDGDYTIVYYPCTEWETLWEGGTCFYEKDEHGKLDAIRYVSYKPNRLIIFPATVTHRAMPVDRKCILPRYVIAIKLQRDANDTQYLKEFYNEK